MRVIDRLTRTALRLGLGRRSKALLETTGRKTGAPRVTPVTNGLDGDVFWIVTEHGHITPAGKWVTRRKLSMGE